MRCTSSECLNLWPLLVCPKSHRSRQNNKPSAHPGVVPDHRLDGKVAVAILYRCLHRLVVSAHRSKHLYSVPMSLEQTDKRCQLTEARQQTAGYISGTYTPIFCTVRCMSRQYLRLQHASCLREKPSFCDGPGKISSSLFHLYVCLGIFQVAGCKIRKKQITGILGSSFL